MEKEKTYSIRYFNTKKKKSELKSFEGKNALDDAKKWGDENLENFFDGFIFQN